MTPATDARNDDTPTERAGRRARRVAAAWLLVIVAASVVDPATILELLGASPTAGADGAGGASAFTAAHLVAYGVLTWLLVDGVGPNMRGLRAVLAAIAIAAAVGVGVELLQAPLAARTASVTDALVNGIGAIAGGGLRTVAR